MVLTTHVNFQAVNDGQDLFYGIGMRKNYRKAFPLLLVAAEIGHFH